MLFGAFAALALLCVFAIAQPALNNIHVFAAGASIGAAYVLLLYAFSPLIRGEPRSKTRAFGRGCVYAMAGYFTLILVAALIAVITAGSVQITGINTLASLIAFAGLGILGGLMFARFRRAETDRQRSALERQQLELARDLQQRLLPPSSVESDRYRVTARNVAAQYIAGDFYDYVPLGDGRLLLVLADVAGKGVSAGLIMATVKAMIPLLAAEQANPAPLLGRLNERLTGQLPAREFVAMTLALYDAERGVVTVANAGLPDPLLVATAEAVVADGPRYPIGVRKVLAYESITAKLGRGERLILFTDGLPEAPVDGEPLGYERLATEVQRSAGDLDALFASLEKLGAAHDDDWTAVVLEAR
jgi:sigma-B regulation protein RsbU (phosphoserine phosphatase)